MIQGPFRSPRSFRPGALRSRTALGLVGCAALVLALSLAGCGKKDPEPQTAGRGQPQAAGSAANATKNKTKNPATKNRSGGQRGGGRGGRRGPGGWGGGGDQTAAAVAVAPVTVGPIASYYKATATLEAEKEAEVLARVSGVVRSLKSEEGDRVSRGAALLQVDDREYRLRLAQARAATANLTARHDRLKKMWEGKLVSAEEYEAVRNDLESAKAEEGLAELNLSYTRVESPFNGRVVQRLVDVGQNVNNGTPLFVLSDFDPLLARVHVPSKEFRRLKPEQEVTLVLDSDKKRLKGRITLVSPIIDPTSGTIKVTIEIPEYPEGTRPGDFAEVSIVTEQRMESVLVPRIAVLTDKSDQVVYVAQDTTAERRVVEVGFQDDEHSEILSGVTPGELVVVKGQRSLKDGQAIKVMDDVLKPASASAVVES